eukprot:gene31106-6237_t
MKITLACSKGGKPSWEVRHDRAAKTHFAQPSRAGKSCKSIKKQAYARSLGLTSTSSEEGDASASGPSNSVMDTVVQLEVSLHHAHHEPGSPEDLGLQRTAVLDPGKAIQKLVEELRAAARGGGDQEAIQQLVEEHRAGKPTDKIFFRGSAQNQRWLLIYQSDFQQHMMAKYGGVSVGMDNKVKVVKCGFPMYILTVVTNHNQTFPVAIFFTQDESSQALTEALQMLRGWNPSWQPHCIMIGKNDVETIAVNEAFLDVGTRVLLPDFQRLQSWWRWIQRATSLVPQESREALLGELAHLAESPTVEDSEMYHLIQKFK